MEAKDFEFYSIGQYHDLVMSGDGAIFELNESRAMINIAFTDMTNEEITQCALELLPMLVDLKIVSNQVPAEGTYWFDMIDIIGVESSVIICDLEKNSQLLAEIAEPQG